ncbi:putative PIN and TRAM-domain containing protein YacL [Paenibacillus sp. CCS19]|uniref:PIN/TRAM domain-containing protein n=1 Tax=Paenibacillus sp. CCS19 TaxID=3158387 RepID=UPI002564F12C|nr:PIN/TRAM domain-containing protein [Paenibacillus cellulosilyticus]GMK41005.1 putative PIN and TRAM-domain containing protein YacL [Paenibacillus cellulosilyticus]
MKRIIQIIGIWLGGLIGSQWHAWMGGDLSLSMLGTMPQSGGSSMNYLYIALGAFCGFAAATTFAAPIMKRVKQGSERLASLPAPDLMAGAVGMFAGLVFAALLYPAVAKINGIGLLVPVILTLLLGYMGLQLGLGKKEELSAGLTALLQRRAAQPEDDGKSKYEEHKILDTSVIIDGRIADICKTGFIEGTLVIPEFVLEELQHIADSSDLLKRNRGRRGLDILNKIQKELDVRVLIYEGDFEEIGEVDSKLVKLAKALGGKVVTNDFNLNKVCELQGVSVLNINDLANAVKPVVLPGEEIVVQVIKDGKEHGQGVAYLDDGTMIVVEGGRDYIGTTMEVLVTSVLQTSAGRMIFAKPKLLEKAQ